MRYGLMVLGLFGVMVAAFAALPTEKVWEFSVPKQETAPWSTWNADLMPLPCKSGLRIAVEGRLKWLGLELSPSSPDASPGSPSATAARGST